MILIHTKGESKKSYCAEEPTKVLNHFLKCSQSSQVPMVALKEDNTTIPPNLDHSR